MSNFIVREVEKFLEENPETMIKTRFPPEPNGHIHIGHAKSIILNFELAEKYGGECYLRFDDTNPDTESSSFVNSIIDDIRWLGYSPDRISFASEYFPVLYNIAVDMTLQGLAYVCTHTEEEISEMHGTVKTPGTPCSCRSNSANDNIDLLNKMYRGSFEEGAAVLRAKIDLSHNNMKMRDPIVYRVKKTPHHRTLDFWKIYPMYDFAHALSDSIENITHSICTLEFDNNRELYDWYVNIAKSVGYVNDAVNKQFEMARLNVETMVLSKRKLKDLVDRKIVIGWDDPVMPTISGMRERGILPESIKRFVRDAGVSRADNSVSSINGFNSIIREDLNLISPRIMGVLDPILMSIEGLDDAVTVEADHWPRDIDKTEPRDMILSPMVYVDASDYTASPNSKWKRLAPGRIVRLKNGCLVECLGHEEDHDGNVIKINARLIPGSIGGSAPEGVKPKGTITWVSNMAQKVYFRVPNPLFNDDELNPNHTDWKEGYIELGDYKMRERYQIERQGYFIFDTSKSLGLTRVASLKDTWRR